MKRLFVFATAVALSLVSSTPLLAQSNPEVGTWKLNLTKSKFSSAAAAPKSETRTVEAQGQGISITQEGVAADGGRITFSYVTNLDGKNAPISGVGYANGADTIAVKRVSANTTTSTATKAGKMVQAVRFRRMGR